MIETKRGNLYQTRELSAYGVTSKLKSKYIHHVLLLDTTPTRYEYERGIAVDSLNSLGWVTLDDIRDVLGEEAARKVIAFAEERNREVARKMEKEYGNTDTKATQRIRTKILSKP